MEIKNILSEEETDKLIGNNNIIVSKYKKESNIKLSPIAQKVYDFYEDITSIKSDTKNEKIVYDILGEIRKYKYITPDPYKIYVDEHNFEYMIAEKDLKIYKATHWYFSNIPKNRRMWAARLDLALFKWFKFYMAGIIAYKFKENCKVFILSPENLKKLYDVAPEDIKSICKNIYGVGREKAEIINDSKNKYINDKFNCHISAIETNFYTEAKSNLLIDHQNAVMDYIENKYGYKVTLTPNMYNMKYGCNSEEFTIDDRVVEIDRDNPFYWANWNLDIPKKIIDTVPVTYYPNLNFKLVDWLSKLDNKFTVQSDIISINVHSFISAYENIDEKTMIKKLLDFLSQTKPTILVCQEFPFENIDYFIKKYKPKCYLSVPNGTTNEEDLRLLVCSTIDLTINPVNTINEPLNDLIIFRQSIMVNYNNKKILFTHGPIGELYIYRKKFDDDIEFFNKLYKKNTQMRLDFYTDILKLEPDMVIGDLNFLSVNEEELSLFKNYLHDNIGNTSIYGVNPDWIFYKPHIKGTTTVYNWNYSDHLPIGYKFNIKSGGAEAFNWISIIVIIILIILYIYINYLIFSNHTNIQTTQFIFKLN